MTFARWLKEARKSQVMPENGRPWTVDYFLAQIKAETGWAPAYAPYLKAERGESEQRPDTRARIVAYWASKGVPGPAEEVAAAPTLSLEERQLALLERQVMAAERQAAAMELHVMLLARQTVATEIMAGRQSGRLPEGQELETAEEAVLAWGRSALARTRSLVQPAGHAPLGEG